MESISFPRQSWGAIKSAATSRSLGNRGYNSVSSNVFNFVRVIWPCATVCTKRILDRKAIWLWTRCQISPLEWLSGDGFVLEMCVDQDRFSMIAVLDILLCQLVLVYDCQANKIRIRHLEFWQFAIYELYCINMNTPVLSPIIDRVLISLKG